MDGPLQMVNICKRTKLSKPVLSNKGWPCPSVKPSISFTNVCAPVDGKTI